MKTITFIELINNKTMTTFNFNLREFKVLNFHFCLNYYVSIDRSNNL